MPGRLIAFILILLAIVSFIGFNIENSSDIRIWFGEKGVLSDVPIFVSFFVMYLIGVISVVPFMVKWRMKKASKDRLTQKSEKTGDDEGAAGSKKKKTRILGSKKKDEEPSEED
ncbi:MAG: hypothetical protein RQ801_00380 [Spirochaetaceae bacterium]|nr:hypothetical protein [Spirochaetaceae bacterium]MDT8296724.1 hypothetical protein [Spirochaetaceae bacterium]